jgi:hypothetical protein
MKAFSARVLVRSVRSVPMRGSLLCGLWLSGCAGADPGSGEPVAAADDSIQSGTPASPSEQKTVYVSTGCTGTLLDASTVLTAAHCFPSSKDPGNVTVRYDTDTRRVAHVVINAKAAYFTGDDDASVDSTLLFLESPFTFGVFDSFPSISGGKTSDLLGTKVTCYGYGAQDATGTCSDDNDCATGQWCQWGTCMTPSSSLRKGVFKVIADQTNSHVYFDLDVPNAKGQIPLPGDSGGACVFYNSSYGTWHIAVTDKAGNGVDYARYISREAFGAWASARLSCPNFDPRSPATTFCSAQCPCDVGQGDCDSSAECRPGLACVANAGPKYGLPSNYDVCEAPSACADFSAANPSKVFCTNPDCPCTYGEGDCDTDQQCGGELVCRTNAGYAVGLPDNYDICVYPTDTGCNVYDPASPSTTFCSTACPCDLGEGDCDSDAECRPGLKCKANVGSHFGLPADYDVCVKP